MWSVEEMEEWDVENIWRTPPKKIDLTLLIT